MQFSEILARFGDATEETDGYVARCPAHNDSRPSLKIWLGDDGTVRMTCRAGCATPDVIKAAGLKWRDMFNAAGDATVSAARPEPVSGEPLEYLGRYAQARMMDLLMQETDAQSATQYLQSRFGLDLEAALELGLGIASREADPFPYISRTFRAFPRVTVPLRNFAGKIHGLQGRDITGLCDSRWVSLTNPDGAAWGRYGWFAGHGGFPVTLVTEGPGDALTAVSAGYNAVAIRGASLATTPGLFAEFAAALRDTQIIVCGDNDTAGDGFARRLAAGLAEHGITVYALAVPVELGKGGDLTDWREAVGRDFAAELHTAVKQVKPVSLAAQPDDTETYWSRQMDALIIDQSGDVRHVNYAAFVADQTANTLKFVPKVGWFIWTGKIWQSSDDGAALQAITQAARTLAKRASESTKDTEWATKSAAKMLITSHRLNIAREMAVLPEFTADVNRFDSARHLMTFPNGTVDLRTGALKPHDPADYLTQIARVEFNPAAKCPRWERFVTEVFPDEPELQAYYQTFLGYAITGEVREHALGVWYGAQGRNGKGTTIRTLQACFGSEMVREVPFQTFENIRGQEVHTELTASLRDARVVVAQEGNEGTPMNTALLKNWSGGDVISARHLYGREFNFEPHFTIILATNHLPQFSTGGAPLWARTKAILFGQSFANRKDMELEPTIQGPEAPGVAAWVVRGAMRYYAEGLRDPLAVIAATEHHKDAVDPLKDLVGDMFDYAEGHRTNRQSFNAALKEWREINGDRSGKWNPGPVKRHLLDSGKVREVKSNGAYYFEGLRLMSDPESPITIRQRDETDTAR
jgi:putative DNA primase/helicase